MKALATYSIKGGVGKTTTAVNVSFEAASSGARVLLWDLDPQGAATFFFRVKPRVKGGVRRLLGSGGGLAANVKETDVGLHLVPADFSLRHLDVRLADGTGSTASLATLLEAVDDDYDVAILDCAPGITLGSEAVFRAADALLVPTVPTTLSVRTLDQLTTFLDSADEEAPDVWPFVSMLDRRKTLHRELIESLADADPPFLATAIPNASAIERMAVHRAPLGEIAPRSRARHAFTDLWTEVAARLWPS